MGNTQSNKDEPIVVANTVENGNKNESDGSIVHIITLAILVIAVTCVCFFFLCKLLKKKLVKDITRRVNINGVA